MNTGQKTLTRLSMTDTDDTERVFVVLIEDQYVNGSWVAASEDVYETPELAEEAAQEQPDHRTTRIGEWEFHTDTEKTDEYQGGRVDLDPDTSGRDFFGGPVLFWKAPICWLRGHQWHEDVRNGREFDAVHYYQCVRCWNLYVEHQM